MEPRNKLCARAHNLLARTRDIAMWQQPPLPPAAVWETDEELTTDEREDWDKAERNYERLVEQSRRAAAEQQAKLAAAARAASPSSQKDDTANDEVPIDEALLSSWVPTRVTSDADLIAFSIQATAIAHTARRVRDANRPSTAASGAGGALVIAGDPDAPLGEQLAMIRARYPLANLPPGSVRALSFAELTADLPYSAFVGDGGADADAMHGIADWLTSVLLSEEPFASLDEFVAQMLQRTRKTVDHQRDERLQQVTLCFYCSGQLFVHCALDANGRALRGFVFTWYSDAPTVLR
jgi:hypothetical protein